MHINKLTPILAGLLLLGCSASPTPLADAGLHDGAPSGDALPGRGPAFTAKGEVKLGGQLATTRPEKIALRLSQGATPSALLALEWGQPVVAGVEVGASALRLSAVSLKVDQEVIYACDELVLDLDSGGQPTRLHGKGTASLLAGDMIDQAPFTLDLPITLDTAGPQVDYIRHGDVDAPLPPVGAIELYFSEPVPVAAVTGSAFALRTTAGASVALTAKAVSEAGGVTTRVDLRPESYLPLGAGKLTLSAADASLVDLAGNRWSSSLTFEGPAAGAGALEPTSFEDGALHGFTGTPLAAPKVESAAAPVAQDGTHVLRLTAPGAWGAVTLPVGAKTLTLRLTLGLLAVGGDPMANPEWVHKALGFEVSVAGKSGRVTASRDLTQLPVKPATAGGTYLSEAELLTLDVSSLAGQSVVVMLAPRDFSKSPATAYGILYLDTISF